MKKQNLKEFEARMEKMNPRKRRSFLHSLYTDLMGYNHPKDNDAAIANSPFLMKAQDVSLEVERDFIECGANILKRFSFTSHAKKLVDSYQNTRFSVDPSEGYTAENRTRALDRLTGIAERVLLIPTKIGNVVQLELYKEGYVGFCVSHEPMSREQAMQKYSPKRFQMGISGVGFGILVAKHILEGKADKIQMNTPYRCVRDKDSFHKALGLAYSKVA